MFCSTCEVSRHSRGVAAWGEEAPRAGVRLARTWKILGFAVSTGKPVSSMSPMLLEAKTSATLILQLRFRHLIFSPKLLQQNKLRHQTSPREKERKREREERKRSFLTEPQGRLSVVGPYRDRVLTGGHGGRATNDSTRLHA
eukprot:scaffold47603_cov68-Phaeocystis_antarctica.AAC.8